MDPALYDLIEPAVVFATLLGTIFGVKLLIWGRGPIRQLRGNVSASALEQRLADLEERLDQSNDVIAHQAELLDEVIERVDFAERVLTKQRHETPKGLKSPD